MTFRRSIYLAAMFCSQFTAAAPLEHNENNIHQEPSIPLIKHSATIDGELTEPHWAMAKKVNIQNETYPRENKLAPVKTEAFVYENGETLFVAFKAYDPNPNDIRAYLTDRDNNWNDDKVSLKIDSYHDHALAYQFFVNPLGTQADLIENELTNSESSAWDGIWESAGKITDFGYQVEMAIPLRILNFNDSLNIQKWGMEFVRFYPRDTDMRISNTNIDHDVSCWICQMPIETGFSGAKQGNNLTAIPTFVTGVTESRNLNDGTEWQEDSNADIGLDLKWGITPDITFNATVNPDFSQVEADSGQLDVNNTFALYLQEKRSFFLENQDYFSTPINLIYTRNINAPDYGAKITGKTGAHSFAGFIANDKTANIITPGNISSRGHTMAQDTLNTAVRYRYAVNNELALGVVATLRDNDDYQNQVVSLDAKYKPTPQDTVKLQLIQTDTQFSDQGKDDLFDDFSSTETNTNNNETTFSFNEQYLRTFNVNEQGNGFNLQYLHENRDWYFKAEHQSFDENFRADLAFFDNVDYKKSIVGGGYTWRGEDKDWWTRIRLYGDTDIKHNQNGELLEQENEIYINFNGPKQSFAQLGFMGRDRVGSRFSNELTYDSDNQTVIDADTAMELLAIDNNTDMFYERNVSLWAEFKPIPSIWLGNYFKKGKGIDYANNRLGDIFVIEPNVTWNINTHLKSQLRYEYTTMDYNGENVFTANLLDLRNTYQFSIKSFLRLSIIYKKVDRNLQNYNEPGDRDEVSERLSAQLLYSYKINPQTLFFVGYSQAGIADDDYEDITTDNRSLFMKVSYAWLL